MPLQIRNTGDPIRVIGHRGAVGYAPENTIESFQKGFELGANWVETDVQKTADDAYVLMHDLRAERTTNGGGEISNLTLNEIKKLDAGSWFSKEWAGARVPTLDEMLAWAHANGKIGVCLDLSSYLSLVNVSTISQIVTEHSMAPLTLIISRKVAHLERVKNTESEISTGLLYGEDPEECLEAAIEVGVNFMHPNRHIATEDLIKSVHDRGLPVAASVNSDRYIFII